MRSAALVLLALLSARPGVAAETEARRASPTERAPLVFVPGVTGSNLVRARSGRIVWGTGWRLLLPRDGGRALSLPIAPDAPAVEEPLVGGAVIRRMTLLFVSRAIYEPLFEALASAGYVEGDPAAPEPSATFYPFGYDWRRETQTTAAALDDLLARVARARGRPEIDLACQSNAARICRWVAKHGGRTLAEADSSSAPARGYRIERLILIGASNGGAVRTLRELDRGRRYLPCGRRMTPETLATMPSLIGDLPADAAGLFVDIEGRALDVDLYDAAEWLARGWSIFGARSQKRLDAPARRRRFGAPADQLAALQGMLDRARATHETLARDAAGFGSTALHLIVNESRPTPSRAVVRDSGRRRLLFAGDRALRSDPELAGLVSEPGDGHATARSQRALSAQESAALAEVVAVDGGHFEVVLTVDLHRALLDMLERPVR
ncbi:MAG TPA: hypothetical protein VMV46_19340 [Thermoanaerobaculia bacterium]|nr:hypothetical protein [Thermoanaerobaculia bacterium]